MTHFYNMVLMIRRKPYQVSSQPNLKNDDGNTLFGEIDHLDLTIVLNSEISKEQAQESLIHEAIHGIMAHSGMDISEEAAIVLGVGIAELIDNNPDLLGLFGYFKEKSHG